MRTSKIIIMSGIFSLFIFGAVDTALASHGKVGLWDMTVTMGGSIPNMPDMSKLPPEAVARMKSMGMSMGGNTIKVQHCMTAQEVATDVPKMDADRERSCAISNMTRSGNAMSADMICTGEYKGTGHVQFIYDSDTHYTGEIKMNGVVNGQPMAQDQKMEGKWVSASCGNVDH